MLSTLKTILDHYGVKKVTSTDVTKSAYVPNEDQKHALRDAGVVEGQGGGQGTGIKFRVLFDPNNRELSCSYYASLRSGSGRPPELRIGQGIIPWLKKGDEVLIGNIGADLYISKLSTLERTGIEIGQELFSRVPHQRLLIEARKAQGKPARRDRAISDFVRNPFVVAATLHRAAGRCEMPACERQTFMRPDKTVYLEVHHVKTLAEGGDDSLENVAALCPACHRELHYGENRLAMKQQLTAHVSSLYL